MHFCLHTAQWKPFYLFTHSFQRLENVFICLNEAFHLPTAPSQPMIPNGYCHNGVPQCNVQVAGMSQWWKGVKKKPYEDASFGPLYYNAVWTRNDPREMFKLIQNKSSVLERRKTVQVWEVVPDHAFWGGKYVIISYDLVFVQFGKI